MTWLKEGVYARKIRIDDPGSFSRRRCSRAMAFYYQLICARPRYGNQQAITLIRYF